MRKSILFAFVLQAMLGIQSARAQADYKMAGPYEVVARDGEFRHTKGGSERDMEAAFVCAQKGYDDKALEIINAYATTLQRLDGHDAPLCAIQGYQLVRAMTLMKPKVKQNGGGDLSQWAAMIRRAFVPTMDKFEADSPYANGNWGAIVNRLRMACAIFLEDSVMYKASVDYYLHANDNGSLPKYISETGQCQETGRDQGHVQLGLEALAQTCEMAWEQGDDLYGALDNRLMQGYEYTAKYNLGYDVPYEKWTDCTGLYCEWDEPGEMGRGNLWKIYDIAYNHYVGRKGLKMPYTEMVIKGKKPKVKEYEKLHQTFTYPAPVGAPLKHDYEVYVQPRGAKEWRKIDTYMARVNSPTASEGMIDESMQYWVGDGTGHKVTEISYAMFDFTGDVFVRVICKNKKYKTARIRPDYRGVIANVQNDSTLQFLLFQPENVSVEFDGDITNNLLIFTSKPAISQAEAQKQAKKEGRQFISYPAGLYNDEIIKVPSNTTVYLEGGAYFTGTFAIEDAENVSILGRGIARPSNGYEGCHVHRSQNVLIDGMVLNTCPIGESDGVTLHDVRSISHPSWGDGLNVFASSNVLYDRVFCRNSDDCTTAYATRKGFNGSVRNVCMKNSTLWADVAHPIMIGVHGNSEIGDSIIGLTYENIDILCQSERQTACQGSLAIVCGDNNYVKDVLFDNIRIEQIRQGSICYIDVEWGEKYCTAPGKGVENVTFRNIRYYGKLPNMSFITGYNEERKVKNVTFEGLKINGHAIYDDMPHKPKWYATGDYMPLLIGNHVENLQFLK